MNVKSISLDLWSAEEIALLRIGGNTNFKNFLKDSISMTSPTKST